MSKHAKPSSKQENIDLEQDSGDIDYAEKIAAITAELENEKDKFLRLFAEFENYKKRNAKERLDLFKTAGQEVILAVLPVLDDFDRAIELLTKLEVSEDVIKGVQLIQEKLQNTLKSKGLEDVIVEKHATFDADVHEAITKIPATSEDMKGKIVDIVEKGYTLGDKIIRYPKVIVAN